MANSAKSEKYTNKYSSKPETREPERNKECFNKVYKLHLLLIHQYTLVTAIFSQLRSCLLTTMRRQIHNYTACLLLKNGAKMFDFNLLCFLYRLT